MPMFNALHTCRKRVVVAVVVSLMVVVARAQQFTPLPRGPLARLVKTSDEEAGRPPYALTDQGGTIQRYVEPVPGIDLEPYVNQVVAVRHDTGETLLASQLELPGQSLLPLVPEGFGKVATSANGGPAGTEQRDHHVKQAEFVDNDDTTVELIEDGQSMPGESTAAPGAYVPENAGFSDGMPVYPGPMMAPGMPMGPGPGYYDPMWGAYPAQPAMAPQYGGSPAEYGPWQSMGFLQPFGQAPGQPPRERPHIYGELEINFIRAHVAEDAFGGKLSEKYEFSPRFILGFTGVGNLNGRARYWVYGRGTNGLDPDHSVHIDFDVFDLEATHRFGGRGSQIELAAGLRLASIEIVDASNNASGADLLGITAAADGWTPLFSCSHGCFGWTYGGRLSLLAGDWEISSRNLELTDVLVRDDNVVVHELYAGIGFTRCCRNVDVNARLAFEMQNWHSDVFPATTFADSIGFVGPGVEIGVQF
jgi:hypothetical protein